MCNSEEMMLAATVLPPEEQEHSFVCEDCEISYSPTDYGVLLTGKKIAYFSLEQEGVPQEALDGVPSVCLCHDCLYNKLKELSGGEMFKIKLIYDGDEHICAFDPDGDQRIF